MNLTYHLIRKDLHALRWGVLPWTLLCLAHLALRLVQHFGGESVLPAAFGSSFRPDHQLLLFLPLLLIPWLIHQDPMRGRVSFWKTLPISRRRLLTAKGLLLLGLFVVLPAACEIVYFAAAGLAKVLPAILADWAWRHLPGLVSVTLACVFAKSLRTAFGWVFLSWLCFYAAPPLPSRIP